MLIEFLHIRSLIFLAVGSNGLPVPTCQLGGRTTLHRSLEPLMVVQHVFFFFQIGKEFISCLEF